MASMTLTDLTARYESDLATRFSDAYLQVKLDDAIALIAGEYPTVATRLASGALSEQNYKRIVADVVFRVIRNPGGYASESEGGVSQTLRATVASGDLWLTERDIRTLTGRSLSPMLPGTTSIGVDFGWAR